LFLDEQYGKREIVSKEVPVDDIIAVNVGTKGRYEEFIVANKPTEAEVSPEAREIIRKVVDSNKKPSHGELRRLGELGLAERSGSPPAWALTDAAQATRKEILRELAQAELDKDRETHTARKAKSVEEIRADMDARSAEIDAAVERNIEAAGDASVVRPAGDASVVRLEKGEGEIAYIVHKTAKKGASGYEKNEWQLTIIGKDGELAGDTSFATRDEAIASVSGRGGKSGPAFGSKHYKVTKVEGTTESKLPTQSSNEKKYEKKMEEDDPRVPPSIKKDALDSIVKEMDRLDKFIEEAEGSAGDADADFTLTDELIEAEAEAVTGSGGQLLIKFPKGRPPSKELKAAMKAAGIVWNRVHRAYLAKASSDDAVKVFGELEDSAKDAEPEPVEEKITKPLPTNPEKQRKELERINDEIQRLHTRANNTSLRSQKEAALDKIEELKKRRGKIFDLQNEAEAKAAEATVEDAEATVKDKAAAPAEFTEENVYKIDDVGDYNTNLNPAMTTGKDAGHNRAYGFSEAQRRWIRKALEENFKDYRENSDKVAMQLVVPDDGTLTFDTGTALSLYKTLAAKGEKETLDKGAAKEFGKIEKMTGFSKPGPRVKYTPPRIPKAKPIPYDWQKGDILDARLFEDSNIVGNEHFIIVKGALDKPGNRVNERLKGKKTVINSQGKKIEFKPISKSGTDRLIELAKSGKDVIEVARWDWDMNRLNRGEGKTLPPVPVLRVQGGEYLDVTLNVPYLDFLHDATGFTEIRANMAEHPDGPYGLWRKPAKGKAVFVGAIMANREGSTMRKQGSTAPKSDPRETVDVETGGEGGFLDFSGDKPVRKTKIEKKWLTDERARSENEAVEDFLDRTKKVPKQKKLQQYIEKAMAGLRRGFVYLPHVPRGPSTAFARERIRHIQDVPLAAVRKSINDVREYLVSTTNPITDHLDLPGLDVLTRKIVFEDMRAEIERAKNEAAAYLEDNPDATVEQLHQILKGRAPLSEADVKAELDRVNEIIEKVPSVKAAYERRQKLWDRITRGLVDRGALPESALDNPHYFRHLVMHHLSGEPSKPGTKKTLTDPYRAYAQRRKGTTSDWLTNLIEVETRALADIYKDNMIQDIAEEVAAEYDEKAGLKAIVRERNYTAVVGGPQNRTRLDALRGEKAAILAEGSLDSEAKERLSIINEEIWELDPTMPMRTKIAMGVQKIADAWGVTEEGGGEWIDDLIEENAYGEEVHVIFGRLNELMSDPDPAVRMGAATILKGINERRKLIKETLGKDFWTVDRVAAEKGLAVWNYQRPNIYYRAKATTDGQIAKMVEGLLHELGPDAATAADKLAIPVDKLKDVLVFAGKRKEFYVPQWLADQLNDLPKHQFDQTIPIIRGATMMWKRWVLSTNPIRYNVRNWFGDAEGLWAAHGARPFKKVPQAFKMLIQEGSPEKFPQAFENARKYGVIETTMQYEFGELARLDDFKGFEDLRDASDLKKAVDLLLGSPGATYKGLQRLTQFREDILRYAIYLDALEQHKKGKFSHKAGRLGGAEDIKELHKKDPYMAAAKVSRETLGDYGAFTNFENHALRQGLMPFYSWLKINTLRYPRIVGNTWREAKTAEEGLKDTAKAGVAVGSLLLRLLGPYAALVAWNQRDDEARKREKALIASQPWLAGLPHLTLDGGVIYMPSSMSDFIEWFAIEDLVPLMRKYERGEITFGEMVGRATLEQTKQPVNRVYQAVNPFMKSGIRVGTGAKTFPDLFEPRQMYDAWTSPAIMEAFLDALGPDVKKAAQVAGGKLTVKDALSYYFSGASWRPLDEEQLIDRLLTSFAYSALKGQSKTTGRGKFEAKKGREEDWRRAKEGLKALGYSEDEIEEKVFDLWMQKKEEERAKKAGARNGKR
jgi:hypothetical protein